MASPFRTFRKNQKIWMAAVTIMAVVAFVFMGSTSMQSLGRGGGRQAAVVQTKFGSRTQIEIANLRSHRHSLIDFLLALDQHLAADSKSSQSSQQAERAVRAFLNLLGPDTDDAAIDRWVYARTAESMGVVVDDRSVGEILSLFMQGEQFPQQFLENALRNFGPGMNSAVLVEDMRQQLLALRLMQLGHQYDDWAGFSASPGERWEYFKRFRQEASVEVALLMPKDFTKGVKDPTDKELEDFFDKYKNVESSPDSPDPGFRIPRKVNVEYLEADKSKIKDQITDAEISEEYDKDPKIYARDKEEAEQEEKQEKEDREKADKEEAAKAAAEKKSGTEAKKNESKPQPKPENKGAAKPEKKSAAKPETTPATKPQTGHAPKAEPKSQAKPDTLKSPQPEKPAATGTKPAGTTISAPRSPFRLAAFTDEKAADKTPQKTADKAPAMPVTDDKNRAVAPPANKPADAKPSDGKKPPPDANSAAKTVATPRPKADGKQETKAADANKPTDGSKSVEGSSAAAGKKDVREPIKTAQERLRESIRNSLATRRFQENVTKVKGVLEAYYTDLGNAAEGNKPAPPDFAALAKEYTMTAHKTGLLSMRQLKETDLGKSQIISGYADVAGELFGPTTLYKPGTSYKQSIMSVTAYVYWKTDDQPERVPKWTDPGVKEKVLQEWKLIQARKLALDAANDLKAAAEKKENSGKPLKTLAAGKKDIGIVQPPKFSWLTRSPTDQSLELSSVGDLTKPGAEFMKQVFGMRPGQVMVATNVAKSEVYVVRMIEFTPFRDLWDEFILPETAQDYMSLLVPRVRNEVDPAWRAQVLRDAKYTKESKKPDDGQPATPPNEPEGPPPPEDY